MSGKRADKLCAGMKSEVPKETSDLCPTRGYIRGFFQMELKWSGLVLYNKAEIEMTAGR